MTLMFDKNDIPIIKGDLCKSYHFTGARRKKHYIYYVAVEKDGNIYMVPTSELEPTLVGQGGVYKLSQEYASTLEIINGHGPGDIISYSDRHKKY